VIAVTARTIALDKLAYPAFAPRRSCESPSLQKNEKVKKRIDANESDCSVLARTHQRPRLL